MAPSALAIANVRRRSWKPSPSARPDAAAASTRAKPSSTLVRPGQLDRGEVGADDLALVDDVGDLRAGARRSAADAPRDRARVVPSVCDEERADRVAAGRLRDVVGVGDEERVRRRGRELLGHADVVERDGA